MTRDQLAKMVHDLETAALFSQDRKDAEAFKQAANNLRGVAKRWGAAK